MNLVKLRDRIQEMTSLSPFKLVRISMWAYRELYPQADAVGDGPKLEARIADDFDDLPEDEAEQFWSDTLNARFENECESPED